jgi:hypothetical protein
LKNIFFKDLILTFLTTPDVEKYLCEGLDSGGLEMHQNMFLTTPDVKKYLF